MLGRRTRSLCTCKVLQTNILRGVLIPKTPLRFFTTNETPEQKKEQQKLEKPPQTPTEYAIWSATQHLYHKLDERLPKYRDYSTLKILGIGLAGALVLSYLFQKQIKGFFSEHGADVASQSLSSTSVQTSAGDLSKAVIQQILEDPKTSDMAVQFLTDLFRRPDTKRILTELVINILQDEQTKQQVSQLAREQVAWYLMNDVQTMEHLVAMITRALLRDETLASSNELVKKILQDELVQDQASQMFAKVFVTDYMKNSAQDLGTHTLHQVLSDDNVKEHATTFVRTVLQDQHIQHDAGYALWEALKVSITPRWFVRSPQEESINYSTGEPSNTQTQDKAVKPTIEVPKVDNGPDTGDEHRCMKPTE